MHSRQLRAVTQLPGTPISPTPPKPTTIPTSAPTDTCERSIQDYDEAIRLNTQYAKAYYNRGLVYQKLGQMQRANQDFDEAIRLNPSFKRP